MKITDELLELSLKKQKDFKKIPDKVNNKIFQMIDDEHSKFVKEKKGSLKEKNVSFFDFRLRYAAVAAAIIFAVGITLVLLFILKPDFNFINRKNLMVKAVPENGILYKIKNDKKIVIKELEIKKNDFITTGEKSAAVISVGSGSKIRMFENTAVKILQNDLFKSGERFTAYLQNGEIECDVKLASENSDFAIEVEQGKFSVKGTRFNIGIKEDSVKVDVEEGTVEFSNYLKTDSNLKKIKDKNIIKKINKIKKTKIPINKNYSLKVDNKILNKYNDEFKRMIHWYIKLEKNNEKKDLLLLNKLNDFDMKGKKIFTVSLKLDKERVEDKKEDYEVFLKKTKRFFNGKLNEKDTYVIYDNNKIYISSNLNKSVYCLNPSNGRLSWTFSHPELIKITSPAVFYGNKVVVPTPDLIFILNIKGELENKIDISQGPSYWAVSKKIDDKLLIPGFKTIFTYNVENVGSLKNINDINGQIYFSYSQGNIVLNCMSDKKIKIYSIKDEKIVWESSKLEDRSFIQPLIINNNIFTADVAGNIYKFNYKNNSLSVIKAQSGITSDLVYKDGYIFYITNNGFFYKLSASKFDKPSQIAKIDENPNSEKYLVKKMLVHKDEIYYTSDSKGLFRYNVRKNRINFIESKDGALTLTGSPLLIRNRIYVIDNKGNLYYLMEN